MPRGVSDIKDIRNIRSMLSTRKRSIPKVASSAHLDLYILQKEKGRLEKENIMLEKRRVVNQKRLDDIKREMEVLEKLNLEEKGRQGKYRKEGSQEKKWKKMALSY